CGCGPSGGGGRRRLSGRARGWGCPAQSPPGVSVVAATSWRYEPRHNHSKPAPAAPSLTRRARAEPKRVCWNVLRTLHDRVRLAVWGADWWGADGAGGAAPPRPRGVEDADHERAIIRAWQALSSS